MTLGLFADPRPVCELAQASLGELICQLERPRSARSEAVIIVVLGSTGNLLCGYLRVYLGYCWCLINLQLQNKEKPSTAESSECTVGDQRGSLPSVRNDLKLPRTGLQLVLVSENPSLTAAFLIRPSPRALGDMAPSIPWCPLTPGPFSFTQHTRQRLCNMLMGYQVTSHVICNSE